jgi:predicted amidohydrolase
MPESYPPRVTDLLRVACVQMTSGPEKALNLEKAEKLVARAASTGADVVVLPEKWNAIGDVATLHAAAEPLDGGESVAAMAEWARGHGVTLVGGSITERREGREKLSNTSLVFDPDGSLVATYRKIHLFDVEVGGVTYRESEAEEPGDEAVVARLEDWGIGLSVCYDIRFPELYRILALAGAEVVTVPAHFTTPTGKDHWHVLMRARAIENQCYVAAVNRTGTGDGVEYDGGSVAYDPWGEPVGIGGGGNTPRVVDIDPARVKLVRARYPFLRELELAREPSVPQFH